ncbi:MAG: GAF domain-containing protein [Chloroflexi bacterium]|nr:GAF domain-containing protein [Chloroflexota bacterium]
MPAAAILNNLDRWTESILTTRGRSTRAAQITSIAAISVAIIAIMVAHALQLGPLAREEWPGLALLLTALPIGMTATFFGWKMAAIPSVVFAAQHAMEGVLREGLIEHLIHASTILAVGFVAAWAIDRQRAYYSEAQEAVEQMTRVNRQLEAQRDISNARIRRLEALHTISHAISINPDAMTATRAALEASAKALEMDAGLIYYFAPETQQLLLVHFYGVGPDTLTGIRNIALGQGLGGHVAATRKPYVIEDIATHTGPVKPVQGTPLKSTGKPASARASIPILSEDRLIGVITLLGSHPRPFALEDVSFLEAVGHEVAMAIERAQLLETATREARQAEALGRRSRELTDQARAVVRDALKQAPLTESRFPFRKGTTERTASLAIQIAARLGLPEKQRDTLALAAAARDSGLLALPDGILTKAGPLSPEEWAWVHRHPGASERFYGIIAMVEGILPPDMLPLIRHHHERWDGAGYPDGLRGEAIPLGARILAVADSYDALTHERPHRRRYSHQEAAVILQSGAGSQWDLAVVQALLDIVQPPVT